MLLKGTNQGLARPYNRRVVLETVRLFGPLSRAEIARRTGLTPPAVNAITGALEDEGLLKTAGRRRGNRGQPPVDYAIDPRGGYSLGLHLDRDRLIGVATDLAGSLLARLEAPVDDPRPDAALPLLAAMCRQLVGRAGRGHGPAAGIGLVLPGPFDDKDDDDPLRLPGWSSAAPAEALGAALDLPVAVENDATAAAVGERLHGAARQLTDFAYIFFGYGLGAGLMVGGAPFDGARGNAGEVGRLIVDPAGVGQARRLEYRVSLDAIDRLFIARGRRPPAPADLTRLVTEGDADLGEWLASAGPWLDIGLQALEALFDPAAILLGGIVPPAFIDALIAATGPREDDRPPLIAATAGGDAGALGAAALPVFQSFTPRLAPESVPG
ncbi:MAG: ROK family transcriptional regulator [Azospirillaceae bacterium]